MKFIAVARNGRVWDPERGKVFSEPSAEKEEVWPVERVGERKVERVLSASLQPAFLLFLLSGGGWRSNNCESCCWRRCGKGGQFCLTHRDLNSAS